MPVREDADLALGKGPLLEELRQRFAGRLPEIRQSICDRHPDRFQDAAPLVDALLGACSELLNADPAARWRSEVGLRAAAVRARQSELPFELVGPVISEAHQDLFDEVQEEISAWAQERPLAEESFKHLAALQLSPEIYRLTVMALVTYGVRTFTLVDAASAVAADLVVPALAKDPEATVAAVQRLLPGCRAFMVALFSGDGPNRDERLMNVLTELVAVLPRCLPLDVDDDAVRHAGVILGEPSGQLPWTEAKAYIREAADYHQVTCLAGPRERAAHRLTHHYQRLRLELAGLPVDTGNGRLQP